MTDLPATELLIGQITKELRELLAERGRDRPLLIGIHTGGAWVAERLHALLGPEDPLGLLDISFYRDDFTRIGMNPQVRPSNLPVPLEGRHVVLIDDVVYTGRTVRAALNELFDYGRPASVTLVTLIDRAGRELPFEPDISGLKLTLPENRHVKLGGPEPLTLTIAERGTGGGA